MNEPKILLSYYLSLLKNGNDYDYIEWDERMQPQFKKYPIENFNRGTFNAHRLFEVRVQRDVVPIQFFELKNSLPITTTYGGSSYAMYMGKRFKVHQGPRGGKYITVGTHKTKHYLTK